LIQVVRVVHYDETPSGKLELKLRCKMGGDLQFQLWLHHEADFQDYAYQLFSEKPLLRWGNSPHYPDIFSAPHHVHDEHGIVHASPLCGVVLKDLRMVLEEIEKWLKT